MERTRKRGQRRVNQDDNETQVVHIVRQALRILESAAPTREYLIEAGAELRRAADLIDLDLYPPDSGSWDE